jgi:hypothetical protein
MGIEVLGLDPELSVLLFEWLFEFVTDEPTEICGDIK